jgi:mannose-6-phosphate isomerase-like protein (cupin superfamily)
MRASFDDLPVTSESEDANGRKLVVRTVVWDEMDANFVQAEKGLDVVPSFVGLPHDNCSAHHWGYILKGRLRHVYNDHEEAYSAGDMCYWPPYHMPYFEEDTELVQVTPSSEWAELRAAMAARDERNAAGAQSGASSGTSAPRSDNDGSIEKPITRASISELPVTVSREDANGHRFTRQLEVWGDQEASFLTCERGLDLSPAFLGLPHDNCPARHWGYVISGRMRVVYNDHEEVCDAGDMFYWPPYHMPYFEEDTVMVEFSPCVDQDALDEALAAKKARESGS